jgi:uncharacterized metal-binding protein
MANKFVIVSCTGMGKSLASISRYSALYLTTQLRPDDTINVCLPCTVNEDPESLELLRQYPVIIIDGCAETCAQKLIGELGVNIIGHIKVWMIMAKHKELKPGPRNNIGPDGEKIGKLVAKETEKIMDSWNL